MKFEVPHSKAGQFFFFALVQAISYFLVVANTRAFTQGFYFWTALTDTLYSIQSFVVIRIFVRDYEATGFWAGLGYVVGGTIGSLISILVTKYLYGK